MNKNIFIIVGSGIVAALLIIATYVGAGVIGSMDAVSAVIKSQQRVDGDVAEIAQSTETNTAGAKLVRPSCAEILDGCRSVAQWEYQGCVDHTDPRFPDEWGVAECQSYYDRQIYHCELNYDKCMADYETENSMSIGKIISAIINTVNTGGIFGFGN